MIKQLRKPQ